MRNLKTAAAFKPAARTERVGSMNDVFHANGPSGHGEDLHRPARRPAPPTAHVRRGHDMKLREIFVEALNNTWTEPLNP